MSCYFRHLQELFAEVGISVDASHKKDVDRIIHETAGVGYKDCPAAWRAVKTQLQSDAKTRAAFVKKLKTRLARAGLA